MNDLVALIDRLASLSFQEGVLAQSMNAEGLSREARVDLEVIQKRTEAEAAQVRACLISGIDALST